MANAQYATDAIKVTWKHAIADRRKPISIEDMVGGVLTLSAGGWAGRHWHLWLYQWHCLEDFVE